MAAEEQKQYYPELDGLRFFAFLLVFIHNSPEYPLGPIWQTIHEYGWIGVDLFFCLSAFLTTKILAKEFYQTGHINVGYFYIRRILRIGPLYYLYIILAIIYIVQDQGWTEIIINHIVGLSTFTYNIIYLFLTYKIYMVLVHLWAISYEMQFYAVIPYIIRIYQTSNEKQRLLLILLIFLVGTLSRALLILFRIEHPAIYMLPVTHFEALLGGFLLGTSTINTFLKKAGNWVIAALGFLCISLVLNLPNTYIIGWRLMITYLSSGIGMTLILFLIIHNSGSIFTYILNNRIINFLGKISFGLYIFHILIISLIWNVSSFISNTLSNQTNLYSSVMIAISLLLTVLVSSISHRWIERPFLKFKQRFAII